MIRIIKMPHLPQGKVKHILIGEKYRNKLENALLLYDLSPIWLTDNKYVDERLMGHADLTAAHLGAEKIVFSEYLSDCQEINKIRELGFKPEFCDNCGSSYPRDAGLNFCILGDRLIHNPKTSNSSVTSRLGLNELSVKQGYTKCSVCVVSENAIISPDMGITKTALQHGIDTLYIDKPFVKLSGFEYGFLGGASFKLSKDRLAFTGRISDTDIKTKLEAFLNKHGIEAIYLTDEDIFDIGSAIPLTEEI